jgi:hypothetical protein
MVGMGAVGVGYAINAVALYSAGLSIGDVATLMMDGMGPGGGMGAFAGAAIGAGIGMVAGAMLAKSLGLSPGGSMLMAIGGAMVGAYVALAVLGMNLYLLSNPLTFWIGVALIVISLFFGGSDCPTKEVTFECKPWKAPSGGDNCEKCNGDPLKPCSEYRCNSLGAACELVNRGTAQEMCHSSNDDGRPPVLNPQLGVISGTEKYGDVTLGGFAITNLNGGCVDAYTPLVFGVTTDELAYCRFDKELVEFEDMIYDFGGNGYIYNHTTTFTLPDPSHGQSQGANWTGDLNLYIKCEDAFGHITPSFYNVDLCVNEGEDRSGPLIRATKPMNNAIVGFEENSKNVSVITNELASCRWDLSDVDYSLMGNSMECLDSLGFQSNPVGYVCTDELLTTNANNLFYVRCMDQPWLEDLNRSSERNSNSESVVYFLRKPEKKIEIDWIEPSQDFETSSELTTIELQVQTSGGGELHLCSYSFSGYENMVRLFETGNDRLHVQPLNRPSGTDKIYIRCEDETGDFVQGSTEFKIIYDTSAPQIARIWQIDNVLHIITTEEAECVYSKDHCNFKWDDGVAMSGTKEHTISVISGSKYHIKCKDEFGNAPAECSMSVSTV